MMSIEKSRIDETFLLNKRIYSRLSIKLIKLILNNTFTLRHFSVVNSSNTFLLLTNI